MILTGVLVNAVAVVLGSGVGLLFKKGIPDKITSSIMSGIGLFVLYVGAKGALGTEGTNGLVTILSMVLGAVIGSALDFDEKLTRFGESLQKRFHVAGENNTFAEGFVYATLLMCVGAMSIVGSMESGLTGTHDTLYAKSVLDGVTALLLTASLGVGVGFAAISLLVYQGGLTLAAQAVSGLLTPVMIDQMTVVGSLLIIGIALNVLNITKLKVANYVLAPFVPLLLLQFFK